MTEDIKTKKEFSLTIRQRLYESSMLWGQCVDAYHSPDDFISSLNALIQSIRNLTFILQSFKSVIPGFDDWYESKRVEMGNDTRLRWAHLSRNMVVKASNLKLKSKTTASLLNWEKHILHEVETDPLADNESIKYSFLATIPKDILVEVLREPLLCIERKWVTDNMADEELLGLTAYCYRYFKDLMIEAFELAGEDPSILSGIEKNNHIFDDPNLFENIRTRILDFKGMGKLSRMTEVVRRTSETDKVVKIRYGKPTWSKNKDDKFLDLFEMCSVQAKKVLSVDGHHVPMIFFYGDKANTGKKFDMVSFVLDGRSTLYYIMNSLADDILKRKSTGVVVIMEAWNKNLKLQVTGESVLVAAIKKDFFQVKSIPFTRKGSSINFGETSIVTDPNDVQALSPLVKALNSL